MMKQSGILFTGKKTIKGLLLGSMLVCSAHADFLMTLTDKDGVEENICVKSYSFSNNLESMHKQNNNYVDEYSTTKEVLTNKTWDGKPVYRRITKTPKLTVTNKWTCVDYPNNLLTSEDKVIFIQLMAPFDLRMEATGSWKNAYNLYATSICYELGSNLLSSLSNKDVLIEYTKTTDEPINHEQELTTLVHYLPSDSTTGEYITKSLNEAGVRFLKNYQYDSRSCVKK